MKLKAFSVGMQVWDIRTKANVHTLTGHTNTVATVRCQAAEPQVITGKQVLYKKKKTNLTEWSVDDINSLLL